MAPFLVDPVSTFMLSARNAQSDRGKRKQAPLHIGIGIAGGIFVIICLLAFLWCWVKRRKARTGQHGNGPKIQPGNSSIDSNEWNGKSESGKPGAAFDFYRPDQRPETGICYVQQPPRLFDPYHPRHA